MHTNLTIRGESVIEDLSLYGALNIDGASASLTSGHGTIEVHDRDMRVLNGGRLFLSDYGTVTVHGSLRTSVGGRIDMEAVDSRLEVDGDIFLNGATGTWSDGDLYLGGNLVALAANQFNGSAGHTLVIKQSEYAIESRITTAGATLGSLYIEPVATGIALTDDLHLAGRLIDEGSGATQFISSSDGSTYTLVVDGHTTLKKTVFKNVRLDMAAISDGDPAVVQTITFADFSTNGTQLTVRGDNAVITIHDPTFDTGVAGYFVEALGTNLTVTLTSPSPNADPGLTRRTPNVVWVTIIVE